MAIKATGFDEVPEKTYSLCCQWSGPKQLTQVHVVVLRSSSRSLSLTINIQRTTHHSRERFFAGAFDVHQLCSRIEVVLTTYNALYQ